MIKKEELIQCLEKNIDIEEKAIPIYTQHLNNTIFLSAFSSEDQQRLQAVLNQLKSESDIHKTLYEGLVVSIQEDSRDVY